MPKEELKTQRQKHAEVDQRFTELRADRVIGENKLKLGAKTGKMKVSELVKEDKKYNKTFQSGYFTCLPELCSQQYIPYTPDRLAELVHYIEETFGVEVIEDEAGVIGIDTPDCGSGSYRWERGSEASVRKRAKYSFNEKESLNETFEHFKGKLDQHRAAEDHQQIRSSGPNDKSSSAMATAVPTVPPPAPRATASAASAIAPSVIGGDESCDEDPPTPSGVLKFRKRNP